MSNSKRQKSITDFCSKKQKVNTERAVTVVETNDEINNNKVIKKNIVINKESEIDATPFIYELFKDSSSTDIHHYQLCYKRGCTYVKTSSINENRDKFQHEWLMNRELAYNKQTGIWWLVYEEGIGMFCLICRKFKTQNERNKNQSYSNEPSVRFKKDSCTDHSKSVRHAGAITSFLMSKISCFQKELDHKEEVKKDVLYQVFYSCYWLAWEIIANHKIFSLLKLLQHLGLSDLKYFNYTSNSSLREIFLTFGTTVENDFCEIIRKDLCYGLLVDDMSDVSNFEQMIAFIQYFDGGVKTKFLFASNVLEDSDSANSEALYKVIKRELKSRGIDLNKLVGIVTDGASVMVGKKEGLTTKLKRDVPKVVSVHCICHKLALSCADTNTELKQISAIEQHLLQLWELFHYSPKKLALYQKTQLEYKKMNITTEVVKKLIFKTLKKACKTRWLSFDASVKAVFDDIIPLTQILNKLEADATAFGLLKKMNSVMFIGLLYILKFVLPILAMVSKIFQTSDINYADVQPTLDFCKDQLTDLKESKEPIEELKKDISFDGRLSVLSLNLTDHACNQLSNILTKYVDALCENIDLRITDIPIFKTMSIFNPKNLPERGSPEFKDYGKSEIEILYKQFIEKDESFECDYDEVEAQWNILKYHLINYKGLSTKECLMKIASSGPIVVQNFGQGMNYMCLIYIARVFLTIPVSNAWPERGASHVKLIKTHQRNRLRNDLLNSLLMIGINGPEQCSHDANMIVQKSVDIWLNEKKRKKIKVPEESVRSDGLQIRLRSKCTVDIQTQTAEMDKNVEINETNMTETQCTNSADDKDQREAERILLELKLVRTLQEAHNAWRDMMSDVDSDDET